MNDDNDGDDSDIPEDPTDETNDDQGDDDQDDDQDDGDESLDEDSYPEPDPPGSGRRFPLLVLFLIFLAVPFWVIILGKLLSR